MHMSSGRRLVWRARLGTEVDFWRAWLTGAPGTEQWASDRAARLNPDTEVADPLLRTALAETAAEEITILDVGAGPLTKVGYRYPGKRLSIVAVDPLADEYEQLIREARLDPPVRTIRVAGEELVERFGPRRFDIAYATNALDHSADPLTIISNMVTVVRGGGVVLLRHKRNEGESARYGGLHQWNFDVVGDRLRLWNSATDVDVGEALAGRAKTRAWLSGNEALASLSIS
jgi:SAM-dependent methyltransferase